MAVRATGSAIMGGSNPEEAMAPLQHGGWSVRGAAVGYPGALDSAPRLVDRHSRPTGPTSSRQPAILHPGQGAALVGARGRGLGGPARLLHHHVRAADVSLSSPVHRLNRACVNGRLVVRFWRFTQTVCRVRRQDALSPQTQVSRRGPCATLSRPWRREEACSGVISHSQPPPQTRRSRQGLSL